MSDRNVIINRERFFGSLLKDMASTILLLFVFWFNQRFIGGSYIINGIFLFLILMYVINFMVKAKNGKNKTVRTFYNIGDDKITKIIEIMENKQ